MARPPLFGKLDGYMGLLLRAWLLGSIRLLGSKRDVLTELRNHSRIKNVQNIQNSELLEEFILIYMALCTIQLTQQRDAIKWKWASNGQFTVSPAYDCQFQGQWHGS
jgi:hypothetical protein